jgi:hypothetical protein
MDGNLDEWDGAFVTPVHVGHPDFANRGGQFLYLWDEKSLYIGLRCLDQHTCCLSVSPIGVADGMPINAVALPMPIAVTLVWMPDMVAKSEPN